MRRKSSRDGTGNGSHKVSVFRQEEHTSSSDEDNSQYGDEEEETEERAVCDQS